MQETQNFFDFPGEDFENLSPYEPSFIEYYEEFMLEGKKWYRCKFPDCGKNFKYKSEITRHHVIHSQNRPYNCSYTGCKKSFKRLDGLETHLRTHTKATPFECNVPDCGQKFSTRASLRYHLLKHNDQRIFKCSYVGCNKSFLTQAQLKQHEKAVIYHQKIGAKKQEEILESPKSPCKDIENLNLEFLDPAPKPVENLQWEMRDLSKEDDIVPNSCKDVDEFYTQFFDPAPKPTGMIQWEMKTLDQGGDDYIDESDQANFEGMMKSFIGTNKNKQNAELYNQLMQALRENYELKAQLNKLKKSDDVKPQMEEKSYAREDTSFFFTGNQFDFNFM